jgi:hypothetical protein
MAHPEHRIPPYADTVRRACLAEVLFAEDLALALRTTPAAARRLVLGGLCPYFRIGRRLAVRRSAFLAALAARETGPAAADEPSEAS